jgi:hypothetical protein
MRVKDVFLELSEVNNLRSIYDELISHLDVFLDESVDAHIPLEGATNESVDLGYIEQVKEDLISQKAEIDRRRDEILEWKVSDDE